MNIFLISIFSYFIGNFLSAYYIGMWIKNIDLRNFGSHNPGTTNCIRVFGFKIGILAFALDFLKGAIPCFIVYYFWGFSYACISGVFVILGHDFPVLFKFKGGKGVATSAGVIMILFPKIFILILVVFLITLYIFKMISLSAMVSAVTAFVLSIFIYNDTNISLIIFLIMALILVRHKENIKRIINNEESKFKI